MAVDPVDTCDHVLDVREIPGEPFNDIMDALSGLDTDQTLCLVVDFEPVPLYSVLEDRGFDYESENIDGTWQVQITHV